MIDYLELILDAQEQDEFGNESADVETVHSLLVRHAAKKKFTADIQETDSQTTHRAQADSLAPQKVSSCDIFTAAFAKNSFIQIHRTDRNTLPGMGFSPEERQSFSLRFSDGNIMQVASRPWVNSAYRESVLTAQAATSLQGEGKAVTVSVPDTVTAIAPSAGKLDEIFARDARRYDSGFSMY